MQEKTGEKGQMEMTTLYPVVQIAPGTWEIDIFDTGSVFVLEGRERALVIDTGIGIGDLKAMIQKLTAKPLTVVMTHGHGDHTGGAGQFGEYFMNEADFPLFAPQAEIAGRRSYSAIFPKLHPDRYYPWTEADIVEWNAPVKRIPMEDGQEFDLGGRVVTAYACPGHTPGSMVLLDEKSRFLFAGDALNCNLLITGKPGNPGFVSIETACRGLKRLREMRARYDGIYNGHHDYRPLGAPLKDNVLSDAIELMEGLISGNYTPQPMPENLPTSRIGGQVVKKNETMIAFTPEGIHDPK